MLWVGFYKQAVNIFTPDGWIELKLKSLDDGRYLLWKWKVSFEMFLLEY